MDDDQKLLWLKSDEGCEGSEEKAEDLEKKHQEYDERLAKMRKELLDSIKAKGNKEGKSEGTKLCDTHPEDPIMEKPSSQMTVAGSDPLVKVTGDVLATSECLEEPINSMPSYSYQPAPIVNRRKRKRASK